MRSDPSIKVPSYRRQKKANGRSLAFIVIDGRRIYLGEWKSTASKEAYRRVIGEYLVSDPLARRLAVKSDRGGGSGPTVAELVAAYLRFADAYYRDADGNVTSEPANVGKAAKPLLEMYGSRPATSIGPKALKAVLGAMIRSGKVRTSINRDLGRIKRVYRWGASEQLVPADTFSGLSAVRGLAYGRSEAAESDPVRPVSDETIEATLPYLPAPVAAMVRLQRLTGCRPGELLPLRPCDIDTSGEVWTATLERHKERYRGHSRTLYFGSRAKAILAPLMASRAPACPLFSPQDADAELLAKRRASRTTPDSCGNSPGTNRADDPKRKPGTAYGIVAYNRAIARGVEKANKARQADAKRQGGKAMLVEHWHPHRIRHTVASELRKAHGLEAARALLGHKSIGITQHYAEADETIALRLARETG